MLAPVGQYQDIQVQRFKDGRHIRRCNQCTFDQRLVQLVRVLEGFAHRHVQEGHHLPEHSSRN